MLKVSVRLSRLMLLNLNRSDISNGLMVVMMFVSFLLLVIGLVAKSLCMCAVQSGRRNNKST